jgi:hypothetical protein
LLPSLRLKLPQKYFLLFKKKKIHWKPRLAVAINQSCKTHAVLASLTCGIATKPKIYLQASTICQSHHVHHSAHYHICAMIYLFFNDLGLFWAWLKILRWACLNVLIVAIASLSQITQTPTESSHIIPSTLQEKSLLTSTFAGA